LGLFAPLGKRQYCIAGWQALLKLEDLILCSPAEVYYRTRRNLFKDGVIAVIPIPLGILDPDVMSFRHDPLVSIGIFYIAIKSQTLDRSRVMKWLMVVQSPILEFNRYTVNEYNPVISKHESTNFGSPVLINLSMR
jgi:hypothetical protein